jgi:hypothetical protein
MPYDLNDPFIAHSTKFHMADISAFCQHGIPSLRVNSWVTIYWQLIPAFHAPQRSATPTKVSRT